MGQLWKPNRSLSITLLLELLKKVEGQISGALIARYRHKWIFSSTYVVVSYTISLQGIEGFLLDLADLNKYWKEDRDHVIIALLGKDKGKSADLAYLVPCVWVTATGMNMKGILARLLVEKRKLGFRDGPVISDEKGKLFTARDIDDILLEALKDCYQENRDMFPLNITFTESLDQFYYCF